MTNELKLKLEKLSKERKERDKSVNEQYEAFMAVMGGK